jgi:hypothetical protein
MPSTGAAVEHGRDRRESALVSAPALWRELAGLACQLGDDELRVLVRIAQRLRLGAGIYGPLCIARDTRAFRTKEAREELEDALVYFACAWLKQET